MSTGCATSTIHRNNNAMCVCVCVCASDSMSSCSHPLEFICHVSWYVLATQTHAHRHRHKHRHRHRHTDTDTHGCVHAPPPTAPTMRWCAVRMNLLRRCARCARFDRVTMFSTTQYVTWFANWIMDWRHSLPGSKKSRVVNLQADGKRAIQWKLEAKQ